MSALQWKSIHMAFADRAMAASISCSWGRFGAVSTGTIAARTAGVRRVRKQRRVWGVTGFGPFSRFRSPATAISPCSFTKRWIGANVLLAVSYDRGG